MLRASKHVVVVRAGNRESGACHALVIKATVDLNRNKFLSETVDLTAHLTNLCLQLLYVVLFLLDYLAH